MADRPTQSHLTDGGDTAIGNLESAAGAAGDLPAGMKVGEYELLEKIGEGGMGAVYSAHHPIIGRKAAVKVVSARIASRPDTVSRFIQEARAVTRVRHPLVIDVFSFGTLPDGRPFFVMEWLEGESLASRLDRGPLRPHESIEILMLICEALTATHAVGVVHRDLKPANVFLLAATTPGPRLKLLDFGVARFDEEHDERMVRTGSNVLLGTPHYVSPEQARNEPVDGRADIYALGVMAYELLLGCRPFRARSTAELLAQHLGTRPPPPRQVRPDVPPALEALLLQMLEKEPQARPSPDDVRARLAALLPVLGSAPAPSRTDGVATPPAAAPRRRPQWALLLALLLVCGAAGVALVMLRARPTLAPVAPPPPALAVEVTTPLPPASPPAPAARVEVTTPPPPPPPVKTTAPRAKAAPPAKADPEALIDPFR